MAKPTKKATKNSEPDLKIAVVGNDSFTIFLCSELIKQLEKDADSSKKISVTLFANINEEDEQPQLTLRKDSQIASDFINLFNAKTQTISDRTVALFGKHGVYDTFKVGDGRAPHSILEPIANVQFKKKLNNFDKKMSLAQTRIEKRIKEVTIKRVSDFFAAIKIVKLSQKTARKYFEHTILSKKFFKRFVEPIINAELFDDGNTSALVAIEKINQFANPHKYHKVLIKTNSLISAITKIKETAKNVKFEWNYRSKINNIEQLNNAPAISLKTKTLNFDRILIGKDIEKLLPTEPSRSENVIKTQKGDFTLLPTDSMPIYRTKIKGTLNTEYFGKDIEKISFSHIFPQIRLHSPFNSIEKASKDEWIIISTRTTTQEVFAQMFKRFKIIEDFQKIDKTRKFSVRKNRYGVLNFKLSSNIFALSTIKHFAASDDLTLLTTKAIIAQVL